MTIDILPVLKRCRGRTRNLARTLFLGGGLYSGGLIFGGKFVLVIRDAYIRGGAYIRDFTVLFEWPLSRSTYKSVCLLSAAMKSLIRLYPCTKLEWPNLYC